MEEESALAGLSRQWILGFVRRVVSHEMCDTLLAPFLEQELFRALKVALAGMGSYRPCFFTIGIS